MSPTADVSAEAVFHVHGVSKIYRMGEVEVHALCGVDLDLFAGELVVLLGASGSGKSTLLNILGGLDVPTAGKVYYRDHQLTAANEEELTRFRREHVGFVFQFYNLIPSLTALENVSLVTEIGLLKAFGYANATVGLHYLRLAAITVLSGALLGALLGLYLGSALTDLYRDYYRFPRSRSRRGPPCCWRAWRSAWRPQEQARCRRCGAR